jgi:lipopolysaccharide biosynthesis glycosyltransferase
MLNFLFAFDSNYEIQGSVAIYSLLESVQDKIDIFVILDKSSENFDFPNAIANHGNLNKLTLKLIDLPDNFYNIKEAHVSKATFYRLYLSTLFKNENKNFIYLDADIICIQDPQKELFSAIHKMNNNNQSVSFADELSRSEYEEPFLRLGMRSDRYFNAGVMIVNLKKWNENDYSTKAINLVDSLKEDAKFWDQDVLNAMIDGNYLSLDNNLNYRTAGLGSSKDIDEKIFIHFSGKSKPWDVGGLFEEFAQLYHEHYNRLYDEEFHLVVKNRKNAILKLFRYRKRFRFFPYRILLRYTTASIKSIINK